MNRKATFFSLSSATLAIVAVPLSAQDTANEPLNSDVVTTVVATAVGETSAIQDNGGPLDSAGISGVSSGLPFRAPEFQIQTDGDNAKAVMATGFDIVQSSPMPGGKQRSVTRTRFDLKATVPFKQDPDNKSFFDFKGIGGGTSIATGINFTFTRTKNPTDTEVFSIIARARNICVTTNVAKWKNDGGQARAVAVERERAASTYLSLFNAVIAGNALAQDLAIRTKVPNDIKSDVNLAEQKTLLSALSDTIVSNCITDQDSDGPNGSDSGLITEYLGKNWVSQYFSGFFVEAPIWMLGIEGTSTFSNADYLDRTAFSIIDKTRTEWDISPYIGVASQDGKQSFRLTASYTRSLELPDEVEVCRPNSDGTQDCISGPDGPSMMKTNAFASAEGRFVLHQAKDGSANFALAPKATYNIDENDWLFELPVYLQKNKDGVLDGGIRFGYSTEKDDFGVAVFVGIPFGSLNF